MAEQINPENKELAKYITTIVGVDRSVQRYWDEDNKNFVDLFKCTDPTNSSVIFHGTIGVSDHPNEIAMKSGENKNVPVELLLAGYKKFDQLPNVLSTAAFYITKDKWKCQHGSVFMRMLEMYYPDLKMKHLMFTAPYLWEDKLKPLALESKTVHWLLGIPISDKELEYSKSNGSAALENVFEKNKVDIFDIDRGCVI